MLIGLGGYVVRGAAMASDWPPAVIATESGTAVAEERRPKSKTRRLAVVLGAGAAIDILGTNFPPHQVALSFGAEYRMIEGPYGALDLAVRVPLEFLQQWTNAGFLVGLRGALTPSPRIPLELVLSGDLGLGVLEFRSSAPPASQQVCASPSPLGTCTLYGVRLHPALSVAYRFSPAFELRAEVLGVELNFTSPLVDHDQVFWRSESCWMSCSSLIAQSRLRITS